jgi:DNA-directed RNA polymerase sigma subunit (sigma70/sigma32)
VSELPDGLLDLVSSTPGFWTPERTRELEARWRALEARDREVLKRRCRGSTLAQVGAAIGLSPSRVQQLQTRALRRLRFGLTP